MTAEQRWILDLGEVLALRLECSQCRAAAIYRPDDWREAQIRCPGCGAVWDTPVTDEIPTPLQNFALGLRQLLNREKATVKTGGQLPFKVKFEIRDPTMVKYGLSTDT